MHTRVLVAMLTQEVTLWHESICAAADVVGHLRNRSHQICLMISCMWLGVQELQIQKSVLCTKRSVVIRVVLYVES